MFVGLGVDCDWQCYYWFEIVVGLYCYGVQIDVVVFVGLVGGEVQLVFVVVEVGIDFIVVGVECQWGGVLLVFVVQYGLLEVLVFGVVVVV